MDLESTKEAYTPAESFPDTSKTDPTIESTSVVGQKVSVYPCRNQTALDLNLSFYPFSFPLEALPASATLLPEFESCREEFDQEDSFSENGKGTLFINSRSYSDSCSPTVGPDGENLYADSTTTTAGSVFSHDPLSLEIPKETYVIEQSLSGSLAEVSIGTHIPSGRKVILKRVSLANPSHVVILSNEAFALQTLHHPRIVSLLAGMYRDDTHAYAFLEYLKGCDVLQYLTTIKFLSEMECRCVFRCVIDGLAYLHASGFVHRDIKPDNLMISFYSIVLLTNPTVAILQLSEPMVLSSLKLIDFGLVKYIGNQAISDGRISGTAGYIAPEIFSHSPYGYPADIYSLGITLYLLLTGVHPFYDFEEKQINLYLNSCGKVRFPPTRWKFCSIAIKDLISQMCAIDPSHRPTAHELLHHPLLISEAPVELLKKI
ncbi:hypothetical protein IE077_001712 [Cardiosporidium cionae]|uniref:Protein kinase domain-containing protein n=1 Tax=Cardiosporidium cionae TaxID=476202 RepID=A0ABQ7JCF1_9APIC|nr:hypothetical protein IE077_001712 [Cardiosporidium cionae]|eukprot:KAF8821697.1 hypothetical protein IE077_001712 [Cardiosporidium cionae]